MTDILYKGEPAVLITDPVEIERMMIYLNAAGQEGMKSTCKKSHRGSVMVQHLNIVGRGYNEPTLEDECCLREGIQDQSRKELCSAQHAEMMARDDFFLNNYRGYMMGTMMVHAKVDMDGNVVPGGGPSCPNCSIQMLSVGIEKMLLLQKDVGEEKLVLGGNLVMYDMEVFNRLSIMYHAMKR